MTDSWGAQYGKVRDSIGGHCSNALRIAASESQRGSRQAEYHQRRSNHSHSLRPCALVPGFKQHAHRKNYGSGQKRGRKIRPHSLSKSDPVERDSQDQRQET